MVWVVCLTLRAWARVCVETQAIAKPKLPPISLAPGTPAPAGARADGSLLLADGWAGLAFGAGKEVATEASDSEGLAVGEQGGGVM